jgi:CheY-like chemotaxis protein/HPt (histidine-containing phosphotransfer) domain-containing protein
LKFNIKLYLKNAFAKGTFINDYNLYALVIVGSFGHPVFAILHLYVFKMPWDNVIVKSSAGLVCLLLATKKYWSPRFQPLFKYYWHFMLIYNLPFLITLTALHNSFIKTWFLWEVIMLYILIMFVPHWLIFLLDLTIGILSALFFYSLSGGGTFLDPVSVSYNSGLDLFLYLSTFAFAIISGLIFSYSNAKGIASEERAKIFKSLAGSIAHELRNPLNAINLVGSQINDLASDLDKQNGSSYQVKYNSESSVVPGVSIIPTAKSKLLNLTSHISDSIANANNIINIILGDLSEKKIDPEDFVYLEPDKILPDIVEKFGYRNDEEKSKVKLLPSKHEENNFLFKAVPDRLTYIVFNLLKNALYYLNQFPESVVTIGTEKRTIGGTEYNVIYVNDTGPGIPPHIIPKLFGDFYTSGKKEGTGLGLSFCKRNMQMFGGDIICESELGKWTRFSLLFPKLSEEEVRRAKLEGKKKKILLVDDQEVNLITTKSKLEKILLYVSCDIARSGKEAISMAKQNKYQLILMDVQMPEISGIEATRKIRSYDKEVPIIALTSLNRDSFAKAIDDASSKNDFSHYLSKSSRDNLLYRGVSKWITDPQDDMSYVGAKEDYLKILGGKKIILADDQQMNRMITKRSLEAAGLIVIEASDGKELLEIYQKSLDAKGRSDFDAIITDVNMPPHDGDDAAKEIRVIEAAHKISHHDEMPIIALSGDGDKEDIHHFFECQMTDYFIKGTKPELLLKIIANYLIKKIEKQNSSEDSSGGDGLFNLNQDALGEHFSKEDQATILKLFVRDTDKLMKKILESKEEENAKSLLLHVHSIKGTAANIGADRLLNYAKIIEPKIKDNSAPENWVEEIQKIYSDLKNEIKILVG